MQLRLTVGGLLCWVIVCAWFGGLRHGVCYERSGAITSCGGPVGIATGWTAVVLAVSWFSVRSAARADATTVTHVENGEIVIHRARRLMLRPSTRRFGPGDVESLMVRLIAPERGRIAAWKRSDIPRWHVTLAVPGGKVLSLSNPVTNRATAADQLRAMLDALCWPPELTSRW
jgi:hypothetical protein